MNLQFFLSCEKGPPWFHFGGILKIMHVQNHSVYSEPFCICAEQGAPGQVVLDYEGVSKHHARETQAVLVGCKAHGQTLKAPGMLGLPSAGCWNLQCSALRVTWNLGQSFFL